MYNGHTNSAPNYEGYQQGKASAPLLQQPQSYPPQPPSNYGTYQPQGNIQNTVVDQPNTPVVTVAPQKPLNYVGLSIFTVLCCCWLFGIIALVYALKVDSAYASGDVVTATSASRSARSWSIAGIIFGSIVVGGVVLINIIAIPIAVSKNPTPCGYNCTDL